MAAAKKKKPAARKPPAVAAAKPKPKPNPKPEAPARKPTPAKAAPRKPTPEAKSGPSGPTPGPDQPEKPTPEADLGGTGPTPGRMAVLWGRLEAWVAAAGVPGLMFGAGAGEKAIRAAEKEMGVRFPEDLRESMALHDGQQQDARSFPWMPGCPPLAPLERIVAEWRNQQKLAAKHRAKTEVVVSPNGRLKGGVYRTGRIPIAGTPRWDGDKTFLDLDPGPAGTVGQLVTMVSPSDFVVIDSSFAAALERWVNVLERGLWVYDRAQHAVHPRALAPHAAHPAGWFSKR